MNKRNLIIGVIVLIILITGVVLWNQKNSKQDTKKEVKQEVTKETQEQKQTQKQENTQEQNNQNQVNNELTLEEIDTSNWKTYRNEELGFEIRYPESWNVENYKSPTKFNAPTPIDCKKTPEKCSYKLILFSTENKVNYNNINAFSVRDITSEDNCDEQGIVYFHKGSESDPVCFITYKVETNNHCILIDAYDDISRCDKENMNTLFKKVIKNIKAL